MVQPRLTGPDVHKRLSGLGFHEEHSSEFLCPVEPLYFSDEKSTTVEK